LKRPSWNYFLYDNSFGSNNSLKINSGKLTLSYGTSSSSFLGLTIPSWLIQNNNFYTVQAISRNNNINIRILDWTSTLADTWATATLNTSNNLYIWSNSSSINQWNDIIDYVKIYKR
jgi:hypothetical protein